MQRDTFQGDMCGFAGIVTRRRERLAAETLDRIRGSLEHRGPDDRGFYFLTHNRGSWQSRAPADVGGRSFALVHNRLSILDLSPAAGQPMASGDGRYVLAFNGLIYNYVELRDELEELGHTVSSTGDTAVLLAALTEWGPAALPRLDGMFALAFLDTKARTVVLARDFAGMKPLYYARWAGGIAFASEIKALLMLPGVSRRADDQHVYDYLRAGLVDHGDGTMFADVRQVAPAHALELDVERAEVRGSRAFWKLPAPRPEAPPYHAAVEELQGLFLGSVERHLRADVPIGVTLSGGLDSTAILCAVRRAFGPHRELHAFSYLPEESELSERRWIEAAASSADAVVHAVTPSAAEFWRDCDALVHTQDQPFGSPSVYAQNRVFRRASEVGVPVVLSGQGADEVFAGYQRFVSDQVSALRDAGRATEAERLARGAAPGLPDGGAAIAALARAQPRASGVRRPWFDPKAFAERGVVFAPRPIAETGEALRDRLLDAFARTSLPHLLRYEDRNSMAFAVESRLPYLTPKLASFALSLPLDYLLTADGMTKAVLRDAVVDLLPPAVAARRDKVGFTTPDGAWLAAGGEELAGLLESDRARTIPALVHEHAAAELRAVLARDLNPERHVWRWINLVRWAEVFDVEFA